MKPTFYTLIAIFLFFHSIAYSADSSQITNIKAEYNTITNIFLKSDKESDPNISTCEIRQSAMPITFLVYNKVTFYRELYIIDPTKPDNDVNENQRLRKSICYYQFGGKLSEKSRVYYEEFFYSTDGKVLFYYAKESDGNIFKKSNYKWEKEMRYYFYKDKVIRIQEGGIVNDSPDVKNNDMVKVILDKGKFMYDLGQRINFRPIRN
ncbi:MAG: hypothetical protein KA369_24095 [Spirochaetes bacterium]|nr:hypothetical protein [Spirochaetota bacterium]